MRNQLIASTAIALLVAACAGPNQADESSASTAPASTQPSASAQPAATRELVGEWAGIHD